MTKISYAPVQVYKGDIPLAIGPATTREPTNTRWNGWQPDNSSEHFPRPELTVGQKNDRHFIWIFMQYLMRIHIGGISEHNTPSEWLVTEAAKRGIILKKKSE